MAHDGRTAVHVYDPFRAVITNAYFVTDSPDEWPMFWSSSRTFEQLKAELVKYKIVRSPMFSLKVQKGTEWELVVDNSQQLPEGRVNVQVMPEQHAEASFWSSLGFYLFHTAIQGNESKKSN